ncbi:MAG: mobile mystery protein A [Flavobacteriales bacterium]
MKNLRNLFVKQLDQRYAALRPVIRTAPDMGWLRSLRMGLGISLQQVADRQGVSKQQVSQAEKREADGTLTINSLRSTAEAMDMELFYVLVPKDGSLQKLIERRARRLAEEIVLSTNQTMKLEGQAVSEERLKQAIEEQTEDLQREIPKRLWD